MGEKATRARAGPACRQLLALSPGMAHFAYTDEDTVIQLNSTVLEPHYVNPQTIRATRSNRHVRPTRRGAQTNTLRGTRIMSATAGIHLTMKDRPPYGAPAAPPTTSQPRHCDSIEHCVCVSTPSPRAHLTWPPDGWTRGRSRGVEPSSSASTSRPTYLGSRESRRRAESLDIDYRTGDAEKLPFADGEFGRRRLDLPGYVRESAGSGCLPRSHASYARRRVASHLAPRQQPVQDVHVMKPYMPLRQSGAAFPVRSGARPSGARAHGERLRTAVREGHLVLSRADGEAAWNTFSTGYARPRHWPAVSTRPAAELRRDFIAFHDGFPTELGINVPREYLLSVGVRR